MFPNRIFFPSSFWIHLLNWQKNFQLSFDYKILKFFKLGFSKLSKLISHKLILKGMSHLFKYNYSNISTSVYYFPSMLLILTHYLTPW